ncbi:hypothetical protein [Streptomyces sp. NPDC059003]|uniref:hypothetical protein n=1 Tax=Streptomyces sp. NPDC059003 TaxID=3346691 RepID=UPI00367A5645
MNASSNAARWDQALERAAHIAAADHPPSLRTEQHWDYVAIRGLLAVVLHALAEHTGSSPATVPLDALQEHCEQGPEHLRALAVPLVGERLAHGLDTDPATVATAGDSMVITWLWLTRTWPRQPSDQWPTPTATQYNGMTRALGHGHPGAAIDILPCRAADAVNGARLPAANRSCPASRCTGPGAPGS